MRVLIVSGDAGGARAVIPVARKFFEEKVPFIVADNGIIDKEAPLEWPRVSIQYEGRNGLLGDIFAQHDIGLVIFTTSVKDTMPLAVARLAKSKKIPVICVLDNWMNYRYRMEIDGFPAFYPDIYTVMNDHAFDEAVADGIPSYILKITGQPALASLGEEFSISKKLDRDKKVETIGISPDKRLVVFISEPAAKDSGSGPENNRFRGYTEKTVLCKLCKEMQPFFGEIYLGLIRHPREERDSLSLSWQECRGRLDGGIIDAWTGREAVFLSDGVAGMTSILLYEAWLVGKPVISLQPGLIDKKLAFMSKNQGAYIVTDNDSLKGSILNWMKDVRFRRKAEIANTELEFQADAPDRILKISKELLKGRRVA